jgi:hypothetical protein
MPHGNPVNPITVTSGGGTLPAPITVLTITDAASMSLTNPPSTAQEWQNGTRNRVRVDLTNATQMRISVNVQATAGFAGSQLRVQYSTDLSTWNYVDGASGPAVATDVATTTVAGSWVNIVVGAKADVYLRVVSFGGDGIVDPSFGNVVVQVK